MFILVLIPVKPNLHPLLAQRARELVNRLPEANPGHSFEIILDARGPGDQQVVGLESRVRHTAPIRQQMIEAHLKPEHDHVLWIDADLVAYPSELPTRLMERNPFGVSAPVVLLDHHPERFYDVAGFVEQGRWARLMPPWFDQPGPVFDLDGVGCLYLVPAKVYRGGGRHVNVPGYTDHLAVCRHARRMGLPVRAYTDLRAYHAYLPDFGEPFHEPTPAAQQAGALGERVETGLRLQQAGRLQEAEALYREVLRANPDHIDALHLLGLLAHQVGRHELALEWIGRALERSGPRPTMLNNLGEAYRAMGRFAEAAMCYREGLEHAPHLAVLHNNLGLACHALGEFAEALHAFDEAVRLESSYVNAHRNRGRTLQELGRLAEAMNSFDQARNLREKDSLVAVTA